MAATKMTEKGHLKMTSPNVVKLPERKVKEAATSVSDFVREHRGLVVAGGVAVGLAAGALLSRGSGRKLARHALTLAEIAGAAGLTFGKDALSRAEDAGGELRKQSEALAEKATKLAEPAEEAIESASEAAQRLLKKAIELAGKLRG
jgi:ElaB/YqjD/DUF883 family membrane-anchored ribosome-binding protein